MLNKYWYMRLYSLSDIISPSVQSKINYWSQLFLFLVSIVVLSGVIIDYGFELNENELKNIYRLYNYSWWIYFSSYLLRLIFQWFSIYRKTLYMTMFLGLLLICSSIPRFVEITTEQSMVWQFFASHFFQLGVVLIFALLEFSKGIVGFINKKTNPAMLMVSGFFFLILLGTLLLLLPRSTHAGINLSIVDSLFISTSSVCVTGLSPFDISQTFTISGQIIIMALIQIGGLGVMTITSFFALFFMGGTGLYSQFALKDMVGSDTFNSLLNTLMYILGFTFVIEIIGALCIWLNIHSTLGMSLKEEIFFSIFHSVSAFCNAGFSNISEGLGNSILMKGHNGFYMVISLLIVLGGIGFPILINFRRIIGYVISNLFRKIFFKNYHRKRFVHLTNINTKIVLISTIVLIFSGTFFIAILEWNRSFEAMPIIDKFVHSIFNSVAPRTAGFVNVDLEGFSFISIMIYMILMWIGGASQSTAGGIKVNTFAVSVANLISVIKGKDRVDLFGRELTSDSVRRASAMVFGSIIVILFFYIMLVIIEPQLSPLKLLFETISAFSTVGASINTTPFLCDISKILVTLLMFIGRVGLITILMSVISRAKPLKYHYPKDTIIIN